MPEREREICARLRVFRESTKLTRAAFAKELGMDPIRFASYELGRAPLRYGLADLLCSKFNVNQRWLALGVQPMQPAFDVVPESPGSVNPNSLFSEVFDGFLNDPTKRIEDGLIEMIGESDFRCGNFDSAVFNNLPPADQVPAQAMAMLVKRLVNLWLNWLPNDLLFEYGSVLMKASKSFQVKNAKQIATLLPPAQRSFVEAGRQIKNTALDSIHDTVNSGDVKAQWPLLKKRLQKATESAGLKSKLAEFLGVKLASVSQWLSNSDSQREPGAETTLQLLNWVEQQERKK